VTDQASAEVSKGKISRAYDQGIHAKTLQENLDEDESTALDENSEELCHTIYLSPQITMLIDPCLGLT